MMILVSSFFVRILPLPGSYSSLPSHEPNARGLHRTKSTESELLYDASVEAGTQSSAFESSSPSHARSHSHSSVGAAQAAETGETSSLVYKTISHPEEELEGEELTSRPEFDIPHPDVRGLALLPQIEFWQLFLIMGLLSGIGLMTIKYVPFCSP